MTSRRQPPREPDERLADWVDGRLDAEELARFEAELEVDAELRAVAEGYRSFVEMVRAGLADDGFADGESEDAESSLGGPDFDRASTDALLDRLAREGLVASAGRGALVEAPVLEAAAAEAAAADGMGSQLRRISLDAAGGDADAAGASRGDASAGVPRLAMWWSMAAAAVLLAAFGLAHWMAPGEPAPEVHDATAVLEHLADGASAADPRAPSEGLPSDGEPRMARGGPTRSSAGSEDEVPAEKALDRGLRSADGLGVRTAPRPDRAAESADLGQASEFEKGTDQKQARARGRRQLADDAQSLGDPSGDASLAPAEAEERNEVAEEAVDLATNESGSSAPPVPGSRALAKSDADAEATEEDGAAAWEGGLGTGGGNRGLFAALSEPVYVLELDSGAAARLGLDAREPQARQAESAAGVPARVGAVTRAPGLGGGAGGPIPPAGPGAADGPKAGSGGGPGQAPAEPGPSGPSTPGPASPGPVRRAARGEVEPETAVTESVERAGRAAEPLLRFRGGLLPDAGLGGEDDALLLAERLKSTFDALEVDREASNQVGAELVPADARALETGGLLSFFLNSESRARAVLEQSTEGVQSDMFFGQTRPSEPEVYAYREGDVAFRLEGDLSEIARSLQVLRERFQAAGATLVEQQAPQLRELELQRELEAVETRLAGEGDADGGEVQARRQQDQHELERAESARAAPLGQTGAVTRWGFVDVLRKRTVSETAKDGALQGAWVVLRLPGQVLRLDGPSDADEDRPAADPEASGADAGRGKR